MLLTGVNNAPRSRHRRKRIDRLEGRDTTPGASMIQKMAPTKLYRNPVVVEVGLVFVWPGYRRCLLWKKKGSLGSKAPVELIFRQLRADKGLVVQ